MLPPPLEAFRPRSLRETQRVPRSPVSPGLSDLARHAPRERVLPDGVDVLTWLTGHEAPLRRRRACRGTYPPKTSASGISNRSVPILMMVRSPFRSNVLPSLESDEVGLPFSK